MRALVRVAVVSVYVLAAVVVLAGVGYVRTYRRAHRGPGD